MTRKEMKQSLKNAVLTATPDVLGEILAVQNDYAVVEFKKESKPKSHISFRMASCAIAAAFMLIIGIFYMVQPTVDSIVSIDVNPGIELSVDPQDTVVKYRALNEDAVKVLDGMNLQGTELGVATDEIIDSMVQKGYLSPESPENTILISVANDDAQKAQRLQNKLTTSVDNTLKRNNAKATILQQNESLTDDVKSLAKENNISVGKADFVKKLAATDESLNAQDLAAMSIKELTSLVDIHQIELSGVVTTEPSSEDPVDNDFVSDGDDNIVKDPPPSEPEPDNSSSNPSPDKKPDKKPSGDNDDTVKDSGIPPVTPPESSEPAEEEPSENSSSAVTSDPTGAPPIGDPDQNVLIEEGDIGPYCEYCGNLLSICEGKCDQSEGKQFCQNCGQLLSVCNGACTEAVEPVQPSSAAEGNLGKNPGSIEGAVMQKGT
ncbi:anti-sigma-I factor RsgI family protein [Anaeromassilibacillus senegalensis]|uniref:anti-sigma-I factor RsgI family protein n=1 Tax=Anaeromassilibacillus senegalensis TaxID=1673717 RepID=UPI00067FEF92|nr:hypothetical protein [Anaeromassilibacillus senegalensis]